MFAVRTIQEQMPMGVESKICGAKERQTTNAHTKSGLLAQPIALPRRANLKTMREVSHSREYTLAEHRAHHQLWLTESTGDTVLAFLCKSACADLLFRFQHFLFVQQLQEIR
jgi:hypothetical protein